MGAETEKLNPVLDFALEELVGDFGDCACSSIADTRLPLLLVPSAEVILIVYNKDKIVQE